MSWPSCCRWKVAKVSTQKVDFFVWNIPAVLRDDAIVVLLEWLCFFSFRCPWNLEVSFDFRMMGKHAKQIEGGVEKRRLLSWWHPQNPRNWHPHPLSLRGLCFKDRLFEEGGDEKNATLKQKNALGCHELPRKNRIKSRLTFWILHLERQVVSGCGTWPRLFSSAWNLDTVQAADRISGANGEVRQAKKR